MNQLIFIVQFILSKIIELYFPIELYIKKVFFVFHQNVILMIGLLSKEKITNILKE